MTSRPRHAPVPLAELLALADAIPADLVALELRRRRIKAVTTPNGCRYRLYRAEKAIAAHAWIVARKDDWRLARKALKFAADRVEQLRTRRTVSRAADPDLSGVDMSIAFTGIFRGAHGPSTSRGGPA
ncbi:hypothetical protein GCM10009839_40150 [Catenulispora yoronensis]|uniref:Uncharacterized protein n=1 Tax=Catenulispora yoronensis TaxID=450799 RepID=A0ABN2UF80_9ACTN